MSDVVHYIADFFPWSTAGRMVVFHSGTAVMGESAVMSGYFCHVGQNKLTLI